MAVQGQSSQWLDVYGSSEEWPTEDNIDEKSLQIIEGRENNPTTKPSSSSSPCSYVPNYYKEIVKTNTTMKTFDQLAKKAENNRINEGASCSKVLPSRFNFKKEKLDKSRLGKSIRNHQYRKHPYNFMEQRPVVSQKWKQGSNDRELVRIPLDQSRNRFCVVDKWQSIPYICLREYYKPEGSSSWRPGKKGLNLSLFEWDNLKQAIQEIDQALEPFKKYKRAGVDEVDIMQID